MTQAEVMAVVQPIEERYVAAFRNKDGRGLASLFMEGATALSEWGDVMHGHADFENNLCRAFTKMPGEIGVSVTTMYAAVVAEGVIVTHGVAHKSVAEMFETLYYTRVLVRQADGGWKIAAVQVAPASKEPDPRA